MRVTQQPIMDLEKNTEGVVVIKSHTDPKPQFLSKKYFFFHILADFVRLNWDLGSVCNGRKVSSISVVAKYEIS